MVVAHHVPAARLTRQYYRRWWLWKGISHARLHRVQPVTELGIDLERNPADLRGAAIHVSQRAAARGRCGCVRSRGDARARAEEAMAVLYFVGYVWDSRRGS